MPKLSVEQRSTAQIRLAPPRRGLKRADAATYVGVSPSKFDQLVADGRMPQPLRIDPSVIWDIRQIDAAFDDLAHAQEANPIDEVIARLRDRPAASALRQ